MGSLSFVIAVSRIASCLILTLASARSGNTGGRGEFKGRHARCHVCLGGLGCCW